MIIHEKIIINMDFTVKKLLVPLPPIYKTKFKGYGFN